MNLLIISDNYLNALYSEITDGSIGYYPDLNLDKADYDVINNNVENTYILALITNDQGLSKLFSAKLFKIDYVNQKYKLSYVVEHVIDDDLEIGNFHRAFPYAFKDEHNAKLSNSKELIRIVKFFSSETNKQKRVSITDTKSLIMNSDAYRLQGSKSQVLKKEYEDGVHSKLSHSISVNYIAQSIASKIEYQSGVYLNSELIESIAMAMNLGEAPLGFVGEQTINNIIQDKIQIIPNANMLNFMVFKHSLQSARVLERVDPVCRENADNIDLDVIAGIITHSNINFNKIDYKNIDELNTYLHKYYINHQNFIGEYVDLIDGELVANNLESQIVKIANTIAQKTYDVELAVRSAIVDDEEIVTRLKLLSEVTGEYFEYNFDTHTERYYSSRAISDYIEKFLIDSACSAFKFEKYKQNSSKIEKYIEFSETGLIVLDVIDNYFQSKLLLSRKVRLFDHNAKQMITNIFREIYFDINLLPQFFKFQIIEEFKNAKIKDLNIVLCFISYDDGMKYLNEILYSDLSKIRNRHEQNALLVKREIIVQAIIDYITHLSDNDAQKLNYELMQI